jgi:hypothetical protein
MKRLLLLATLAAPLAGCHEHHCFAPNLNVYWTPGAPPQGGFQVPGLLGAGFAQQLDCAQAAVAGVQMFVNGQLVQCTGGLSFCVDSSTWRCDVGGLSLPITGAGQFDVEVDGLDSLGGLKYQSRDTVFARDCGDTSAGVFPLGVPGTLSLAYSFGDGANLCAGPSNLWFQVVRGGPAGATYDAVDESNTPGAVACTDTLASRRISLIDPLSLTTTVPAGVYTRTRIEEVVLPGPQVQRRDCAPETIVHAGNENWPVSLLASSTLCP